MKIFLDECRLAAIPRPRRSSGDDSPPNGLDLDKNGELLALASREFDVFALVPNR
jgi:hypothetical protein